MIYKWSVNGLVPVPAQVAGEELVKIREEHGILKPEDVVNASRDENAPLHPCFEWDDSIAAERFRKSQASTMIRMLVVEQESKIDGRTVEVRAFHSIESDYKPIDKILENVDDTELLLHKAWLELKRFRQKYKDLTELQPLFGFLDSFNTTA